MTVAAPVEAVPAQAAPGRPPRSPEAPGAGNGDNGGFGGGGGGEQVFPAAAAVDTRAVAVALACSMPGGGGGASFLAPADACTKPHVARWGPKLATVLCDHHLRGGPAPAVPEPASAAAAAGRAREPWPRASSALNSSGT